MSNAFEHVHNLNLPVKHGVLGTTYELQAAPQFRSPCNAGAIVPAFGDDAETRYTRMTSVTFRQTRPEQLQVIILIFVPEATRKSTAQR